MAKEKDVVLIYFEDNPQVFARIEEISPDIKKDWYHVKLLILQFPLQTINWILRDTYINGTEFTMGGKRMRLEAVVCPQDGKEPDTFGEAPGMSDKLTDTKVIFLADLKKK